MKRRFDEQRRKNCSKSGVLSKKYGSKIGERTVIWPQLTDLNSQMEK
jgi:hypothetical protein